MPALGTYLKGLRESRDRSRRWVEKKSRELYPKDKERHISHSYLRQLEEGIRDNPAKPKLHTLAEIYGVPPRQILVAAGYLGGEEETPLPIPAAPGNQEPRQELTGRLFEFLEGGGIHPEYFINSLMGLSSDSLYIVNRLVTTLSVKEKQLQKQEAADEQP